MRTEWQHANAKYRWLIMRLLSRPSHVIFTSRSGPVYDAQGNITTQTKAKAQSESTYYVDISVHIEKRPMPLMEGGKPTTKMIVKRMGTIEKCRFNSVGNLQVEDITFDGLKKQLEGEVPKEVFGI